MARWRPGRSEEMRGVVRGHQDKIDGVMVTLPNFGEERAIAELCACPSLNVPVLIQATPDAPPNMTVRTGATASAGKCPPATT